MTYRKLSLFFAPIVRLISSIPSTFYELVRTLARCSNGDSIRMAMHSLPVVSSSILNKANVYSDVTRNQC